MLINFSNHPLTEWSEEQKRLAIDKYESICDIPFPEIDPNLSEEEVTDLVQKYVKQIVLKKPTAVHVMGEMTFTYKCVNALKQIGVETIASTTKRNTKQIDFQKTVLFEFVQFRKY
jgi:hypothetical protein